MDREQSSAKLNSGRPAVELALRPRINADLGIAADKNADKLKTPYIMIRLLTIFQKFKKDQRRICAKDPRRISGFTLIELLVAMAVFSVVMITVSGIFLTGLGGTQRIFGLQAVQESGRFVLESMTKEIRMSKVNSLDGVALASLPNGVSGPYSSLNITNANGQTVAYVFDIVGQQVSRAGVVLTSNNVAAVGKFYLTKNSALQPRVTIVMKLNNKTDQEKNKAAINLQTTVSSREYAQ